MAFPFRSGAIVFIIFQLIFISSIYADENAGSALHDIGLFSMESGNYKAAEKQLKLAVEAEPDNPYYRYSMGKLFLRQEKDNEALPHFEQALELNPDVSGLKFDIAVTLYKLKKYERAFSLFSEIADANPDDALSRYNAGMSLFNLERFNEAPDHLKQVKNSPTLLPHCFFTIGVCYYKTNRMQEALTVFTKVIDDPKAGDLIDEAQKWIDAIKKNKKKDKPWDIFSQIGFIHDDNVTLDPLDKDIVEDESDSALTFIFSGKYKFLKTKKMSAGAGYMHYMKSYTNLDQYNLTGGTLKVYADYKIKPFTFKMSVLPSYFWLNSESYLRRFEFRPEIFWKANNTVTAHLLCRYANDKNIENDEDSGNIGGFFFDGQLLFPSISSIIITGIGWENNSANIDDKSWQEWKAKAEILVKLPMNVNFSAKAEARDRKYDIEQDKDYEKRKDRRWIGTVSLSRHIFYEWLRLNAEYSFSKRESNYVDKQYERNKMGISLEVKF